MPQLEGISGQRESPHPTQKAEGFCQCQQPPLTFTAKHSRTCSKGSVLLDFGALTL